MRAETDDTRIRRYASKGVILDSNLLIIYLVGLHDPKQIERFLPGSKQKGRIVCFATDFDVIKAFLLKYGVKKFIVTPHILTEVSNITFADFPDVRTQRYIKDAISFFKLAHEIPAHKKDLIDKAHLPKVGFSDSSIIETAKNEKCLVLTQDLQCMKFLEDEGCGVYNMNHLRMYRL